MEKYTVKENYSEPCRTYAPLTEASRRRLRRFRKVKHVITGIVNLCSATLLMWLFASWLDIISGNLAMCEYAWWNIIIFILY